MIGAGSAIGGVFGGLVVNASGWRWVQWMCTILTGVSFVMIVLLQPETNFKRSAESERGEGPEVDEKEMPPFNWIQSLGIFSGYDR
jgi:MFS family permease